MTISVKASKLKVLFSAAFFLSVPLAISSFALGINGAGQNANSSAAQDSGTMMTSKPKTSHKHKKPAPKKESTDAAATTAEGTNADLSGTYTGTVNYPDGNLSGPATLTITGNDFTLTPDGGTAVSGKLSAVTTRGYTGVAMQMGAYSVADKSQTTPPVSLSLRAKKRGNSLSLTSVAEAAHKFSFMTSNKK